MNQQLITTCKKAMFAGIFISIACLVNLSLDNKIVGSILFSVGLISILDMKLSLFTGICGYRKLSIEYLIVWIFNLVGVILLVVASKQFDFVDKAIQIVNKKNSMSIIGSFFSSIICGILISTAVYSYKMYKNYILVMLCVSSFILIGSDHCIANMFYIVYSGLININTIIKLLIYSVGNMIGSFTMINILNLRRVVE